MLKSYLKFLPTLIKLRKKNVKFLWGSYADKKSYFEGNNFISRNCTILDSSLGRYTYINHYSKVSMTTIGRYSCVGPECLVGGLGIHPMDRLSTHKMFYSDTNPTWAGFKYKNESFQEYKSCVIGNDVWIGTRVIVLDGVSIGHGAIVAAGSVVTKDIEPYSIVGGTPAKHIRYRFSEEVIRKLIEIKWWDYDLDSAVKEKIFINAMNLNQLSKLEKKLMQRIKTEEKNEKPFI